jgi:hypothetical protein
LIDIMRLFDAPGLLAALQFLTRWERISRERIEQGNGDEDLSDAFLKQLLNGFLTDCASLCREIELQESVERLGGPLVTQLYAYGTANWRALEGEFRVLRELMESELRKRRFAFVPAKKAEELENVLDGNDQVQSWESIWIKIPATKDDIQEAVYCYALERNTACVFHSMRVAEHCLRVIARTLHVRLTQRRGATHPIEYAEWDKIINGCKARIDKIRTMPHGPKRQARLERYSDAADHCLFMKDIWRNSVSHTRKPYIESEALAVLNRVREFARFAAGLLA